MHNKEIGRVRHRRISIEEDPDKLRNRQILVVLLLVLCYYWTL